ncbi:MAG: hypothetical protein QOI61_410 [Actinomycetota bacterium]
MSSEEVDLSKYRMGASLADMPIQLDASQVAHLRTAKRNVFVLGASDHGATAVIDALAAMPGVVVPPAANLFEHGMGLVLLNYVAGMHVGYAMSSLADPETFLLAARALADEMYDAARNDARDAVVVDASPANAQFARAIAAVYPDALFVDANGSVEDLSGDPFWSAERPPATAPEPDAELPGRPIFVVGCARSGTTWLQKMLAAHPAIGGPKEETAIFAAMRELVGNRALEAWMPREQLVAALRRFALRLFTHSLATEAPFASRFLEKTPHHVMHLPLIARVFPEAMVVAIYRDGREVVRSILDVPFGTDDASAAAAGWRNATVAAAEFATTFPSFRNVRYEDATENPVERVGDLLGWLELPVDDTVVQALTSRATARVSQHAETSTQLRPAETRTVYRIAGEQLVALGYATEDEVRRVKRQPAYVFDRVVRGLRRLVRDR